MPRFNMPQSSPLSLAQVISSYKPKMTKQKNRNKIIQISGSGSRPKSSNRNSTRRKCASSQNKKCKTHLINAKINSFPFEDDVPTIRINEDNIAKQNMQHQYVSLVQRIFRIVFNQQTNIQDRYRKIREILPEDALYFLGSLLHKIKTQKTLSYINYMDECIKIFKKSCSSDIQLFIKIMQQNKVFVSMPNLKCGKSKLNNDQKQNLVNTKDTYLLKKQKHEDNIMKFQYTLNHDAMSYELRKQDLSPYQVIQDMKETTPKKADLYDSKQAKTTYQILLDNKDIGSQKLVNLLKNIRVTDSIQSKKSYYTPNANLNQLTQTSQNINTPIQLNNIQSKYDDKAQFGLNDEYQSKYLLNTKNHNQNPLSKTQQIIKQQLNQIIQINSNKLVGIDKNGRAQSKNRNGLSRYTNVESMRKKYQFLSPENHYNNEIIKNKDYLVKNRQNNYLDQQIYKNKKVQKKSSQQYNSDRLDKLTNRLQSYIEQNAAKIERSKLARNIY